MSQKNILGLHLPTDPRWADLAGKSIAEILTDHAYCEQKAASTCISLIVQYPEKEEMVKKVSPLVTEEWGHFRMVLREMEKRGIPLGRQRKDEYVNRLLENIRKGKKDEQLMDKLLVSALIEARSCERFRLLSRHISDPELSKFYHDLMVAEAGHYRLFIDLAKEYFPNDIVEARWKEFLDAEAKIISTLEVRGDRVH